MRFTGDDEDLRQIFFQALIDSGMETRLMATVDEVKQAIVIKAAEVAAKIDQLVASGAATPAQLDELKAMVLNNILPPAA